MTQTDPLHIFRQQIDNIDNQFLDLIAQRRQAVQQIGQYKLKNRLPIRHLAREEALIQSLIAKGNTLSIPANTIDRLFRTIIDDSVALQESLQSAVSETATNTNHPIAFLGPSGSYSHLAAETFNQQQGLSATLLPYHTFADIFTAVNHQQASYAIVPLENSSSGSINDVYDLLEKHDLCIVAELFVPIQHCLFTSQPIELSQIKILYSHAQPLLQCSQFLAQYPDWQVICCNSSAAALEKVAQAKQPDIAAIGSQYGGERYALYPLCQNIANQQQNSTRFIVLSKQAAYPSLSQTAKTSLLFTTGQQAGALADALLIFRHYQLVMCKLISRPADNKPWQEHFYVDLKAHVQHETVQHALTALTPFVNDLKVIGCYPFVDYS